MLCNSHNLTSVICLHTFCSIWPTDRTLSGATTLGQSRPGSNSNEEVLHIPQISKARASPWDGLMSYPGHLLVWGESYPSAEMQLVHPTAPADWVRNVLCICVLLLQLVILLQLLLLQLDESFHNFYYGNRFNFWNFKQEHQFIVFIVLINFFAGWGDVDVLNSSKLLSMEDSNEKRCWLSNKRKDQTKNLKHRRTTNCKMLFKLFQQRNPNETDSEILPNFKL